MNQDYLNRALKIVKNQNILINLASKRANEISQGAKIFVKVSPNEKALDIALLEIAEEKISYTKTESQED